jgi:hypothetical protein
MTKARDIASAATAPAGVTSTELGYVDGVTSALQTQINAKQAIVSGVNDTEIGYLDGVTSAIQTQLNSKIGQATAINPTIVDAKGDIIAATAADTVARLAVGANDTVLTADSTAATGLKWAAPAATGGMTLLSTTSLTGSATTVSSISQSYKQLVVYVKDFSFNATSYLRVEFNSDTTTTNYLQAVDRAGPGGAANYVANNTAGITTNGYDVNAPVDQFSVITLFDYANTTTRKVATSVTVSTTGGEPIAITNVNLAWKGTAAIDQLVFRSTAGSFTAGTIEIYGVK